MFFIEFCALKLAHVFLISGSSAKIPKMPNFGSKNCKKFTFFKCNFMQTFANRTLSWGYLKPPCKISALSALRFGQLSAPGQMATSFGSPLSSPKSSSHLVSPILKIISSHLARDGEIFVSFHLYFKIHQRQYVLVRTYECLTVFVVGNFS